MEIRNKNAQNFWQDPHKARKQGRTQTGRDTGSIHSPGIQKEQRKKRANSKQVQNTV